MTGIPFDKVTVEKGVLSEQCRFPRLCYTWCDAKRLFLRAIWFDFTVQDLMAGRDTLLPPKFG